MIMTCLVTSIASERLLAVDWDASYTDRRGNDEAEANRDAWAAGKLEDLFERPGFDWSSGWLERVVSREEVVRESGATSSLGGKGSKEGKEEEATLLAEMLCGDLRASGNSKAVLVLKGHAWWDVALQNPRYRDMFASSLGVDGRGVVRVFERLGPMMLTPVARVREAVEAMGGLAVPGAYMVGLVGPYLGSDMSYGEAGSRARVDADADERLGKAMSKVTYAVLPGEERSNPITYFFASTSSPFKKIVRYMLVQKGGEGSEVSRHRMSEAAELDAMGIRDHRHRMALSDFGVSVHVLSSGSRLIYITREMGSQQGCHSRSECLAMDLCQELVEMWLLNSVHLMLRDSLSSVFATIATSWVPKPSFYVDRATMAAHKQSTSEPHAGGDMRASTLEALRKHAPCFDQRALGVAWLLTSA
jgi:hypothetical protein